MKTLMSKARSLLSRLIRSPRIPPAALPRHGLPFPSRVHLTIDGAEVQRYRQILVIGDVHGCADELASLLTAADATDPDTLKLFAGDMINKGPDSAGVLRMLRRMPHYAVRGNNEEAALREYRRRAVDPHYPLADGYRWIEGLAPGDIDYMFALPYTLELPTLNAVVVHAGLVPGRSLRHQRPADMVTMRNVLGSGPAAHELVATSKTEVGSAWGPLWCGPQHVYFGHDAGRMLQFCEFATGLDTGCVYGRCLTGVFIAGRRRGQLVSVPAWKTYREWGG